MPINILGHRFSFLLDKYLAVELLGHRINECQLPNSFSKVVVEFYIPTSNV